METIGLLERHSTEWQEATWYPFLDAVREGSLPTGAFEAWLNQDYLFVADLLPFRSRLLARAPCPNQAVLADGLVRLEAELGWFEEKAEECGLKLEPSRHPATSEYRDFLIGLENEHYTLGMSALWTLERAYLEAWRSAKPGHPDYRELVERWTAPEFADYVAELERATNFALRSGDEGEREWAEAAFLGVARLERDFWEMAWSMGERSQGGGR